MPARRSILLASVLLLVGAEPYAQPQTDAARQLVGTWRLVSWTNRLADGRTQSNSRSGYLIYSDENRMCAVLIDPKAPKWGDPRQPTGTEAISGFAGLTAYCAPYEINIQERSVIHHVDIEAKPNLVGIERKRFFTFEGRNRLTLRLETSEVAGVDSATLEWERVEAASPNAGRGR